MKKDGIPCAAARKLSPRKPFSLPSFYSVIPHSFFSRSICHVTWEYWLFLRNEDSCHPLSTRGHCLYL